MEFTEKNLKSARIFGVTILELLEKREGSAAVANSRQTRCCIKSKRRWWNENKVQLSQSEESATVRLRNFACRENSDHHENISIPTLPKYEGGGGAGIRGCVLVDLHWNVQVMSVCMWYYRRMDDPLLPHSRSCRARSGKQKGKGKLTMSKRKI